MQAASEQHKMTRAAGVVGLATLASRIGGFVRDVVIAYLFGASPAADAFSWPSAFPTFCAAFSPKAP